MVSSIHLLGKLFHHRSLSLPSHYFLLTLYKFYIISSIIEDSKIIPALLLSYYNLPSHLKRCFAYCALFPKDHEFDKESLILLWMAQNFVQCSQQGKSPDEVGEQYFNDLLSRSFFQPSIWYKRRFVMHDLLNDLAKYVFGEMCFRLGVDRAERFPKTIRHFSTLKKPVECHEYRSLCDAKRLRTFLSISTEYGDYGMSIEELSLIHI